MIKFWKVKVKGQGRWGGMRSTERRRTPFYFRNVMSHPTFTPQQQRITALWPVLISRPTDGRRLSWPQWLVTHRDGFPAQRRSTIPVPADR